MLSDAKLFAALTDTEATLLLSNTDGIIKSLPDYFVFNRYPWTIKDKRLATINYLQKPLDRGDLDRGVRLEFT